MPLHHPQLSHVVTPQALVTNHNHIHLHNSKTPSLAYLAAQHTIVMQGIYFVMRMTSTRKCGDELHHHAACTHLTPTSQLYICTTRGKQLWRRAIKEGTGWYVIRGIWKLAGTCGPRQWQHSPAIVKVANSSPGDWLQTLRQHQGDSTSHISCWWGQQSQLSGRASAALPLPHGDEAASQFTAVQPIKDRQPYSQPLASDALWLHYSMQHQSSTEASLLGSLCLPMHTQQTYIWRVHCSQRVGGPHRCEWRCLAANRHRQKGVSK
jgi:hypothetical protein